MSSKRNFSPLSFSINVSIITSLLIHLFSIGDVNCKPNGKNRPGTWRSDRISILKRMAEGSTILNEPYCSRRQPETCCPNRYDDCTVPISDTLCYCDMFCNHDEPDCCPDFNSTCFQTPTPLEKNKCYDNGRYFKENYIIKKNCNSCKCKRFGHSYDWECTNYYCILDEKLALQINLNKIDDCDGWTADASYPQFRSKTLLEGYKLKLGTNQPERDIYPLQEIKDCDKKNSLPNYFDSRMKWPETADNTPIDQGDCSSSWASTSANIATDRLRILTGGMFKGFLLAHHLISCSKKRNHDICDSGNFDRAWYHLKNYGVSSKNDPSLNINKDTVKRCNTYPRWNRTNRVDNSIFMSEPLYRIKPNERHIMTDIILHGPVQAIIPIYRDFFLYKSGIYRVFNHREVKPYLDIPEEIRYHSIKILGWGECNGVRYWLCANSWGRDWGIKGTFKILRGANESFIESNIYAAGMVIPDRRQDIKKANDRCKDNLPN